MWDQAAVRWLKEAVEASKKSVRNDAKAIAHFTGFWRGVPIDKIGRDQIVEAVEALKCSNSTRNRYVAVIRAILRKAAAEWGWLKVAPAVKTYKEPKRRIRWLTREEAADLIRALPPHYAEISQFALATGLRMSNVLELEWSQLDMQRKVAWVHPDQAKAGRAIGVPLNDNALEIIRSRIGKDQTRVFGHLKRIESKMWKRSVKEAGLEDFRFHDLRHTWASWHVQNGTPLHVLQELGGWSSLKMVQKYAHLSSEHLRAWVDRPTLQLVVDNAKARTGTDG
jgi:integrase